MVKQDLGHGRSAGQAQPHQHLGVDLADNANRCPLVKDLAGTSRMEARVPPRVEAGNLGLSEIGRQDRETIAHGRERRLEVAQLRHHRLGSAGRDVGGEG